MTLADEISAARPEEQRELLERLYKAVHGVNWTGDCARGGDYKSQERGGRFAAMLDCGAYLSAAESLVPENWSEWQVGRQPWKGDKALCYVLCRAKMREPLLVHAATPALALASAIAAAGEG